MRLTGLFAVAPALALAACAQSPAASAWNEQDTAALRAQPEEMLHDLDRGDFAGMTSRIDDDAIVLDLDENNHPVRYQGKAEVTKYFQSLEQGAKAQGLKFTTTMSKNDCAANAAFGYCVVEFDQVISAGGKSMGPFKFRATIVAHKVGDNWRWVHWHGSLREMPTPPPGATSPG